MKNREKEIKRKEYKHNYNISPKRREWMRKYMRDTYYSKNSGNKMTEQKIISEMNEGFQGTNRNIQILANANSDVLYGILGLLIANLLGTGVVLLAVMMG